ncbi:MAG: peroxidase-related enzyme [Ilumatobacteraceae bacterium]
MTWIRTIPWDEATGQLKEAYDWQAASLGEPAEFTMLGSLYPPIVEERLRLYRAVDGCPSGLSPVERHLAAYVVSLLNGTGHCASGLRLKLESLGAEPELLSAVEAEPAGPATGDQRLDAICTHAATLTTRPTEMSADDLDELRAHGLSDLDLVDLNNMIAYYNYINRVVNGLGLKTLMADEHEATQAVPGEPQPER